MNCWGTWSAAQRRTDSFDRMVWRIAADVWYHVREAWVKQTFSAYLVDRGFTCLGIRQCASRDRHAANGHGFRRMERI